MNVISMMHKIDAIPNTMISEPALPDFLIAADDRPEFVRAGTLDQLNSAFDSNVHSRSEQQMNVFGHDDEGVQFVTAFAAMPIKRLQENPHIDFDDKQSTPMVRRERHKVSSRRREKPSRLQRRTSAAESRGSLPTLNWHEWNSCPSRWFFVREFSFWERANGR